MAETADGVKEPVEIETTTTESPTEETNDDGIIVLGDENFSEEEVKEDKVESRPEEKSEDEPKAEPTKTEPEEAPSKNAETRKQQLNNEIRDKVAERNALRREIAELNKQKYQLKNTSDIPTVDALMEQINPETGDYYTRTEAKLARIEAERELEHEQKQMDDYTETIVDNRLRLRDEADRVLKDFPMFDEQSPSYNQKLTEQANRIAEGLIVKDNNTGEIIGSRGSIYDVYAVIAEATKSAEMDGKIAGRKAVATMMNSADVIGSSSTGTASEEDDPFLKGFNNSNSY